MFKRMCLAEKCTKVQLYGVICVSGLVWFSFLPLMMDPDINISNMLATHLALRKEE